MEACFHHRIKILKVIATFLPHNSAFFFSQLRVYRIQNWFI